MEEYPVSDDLKTSEYTETSMLSPIYNAFNFIGYVYANYGWYVFFFVILLAYLYRKMKPTIEEYQKRRAEEEYAAKYHKNPDLLANRLSAQQSYVEKLQRKYNKEAEEYEQKMKEKEAKKREELLAKYKPEGERLGGASAPSSSSSSSSQKDKSKSFKPEYNPLMGGSSHNYRAPKRSGCGGGGCGR